MPTQEEKEAIKAQKEAEKAKAKADKEAAKAKAKEEKEAEKEAKKAAKNGETASGEATVEKPEPPLKDVMFEGAKVVKILQDNRHTPTMFHCQMDDGTTRHVPKELFA